MTANHHQLQASLDNPRYPPRVVQAFSAKDLALQQPVKLRHQVVDLALDNLHQEVDFSVKNLQRKLAEDSLESHRPAHRCLVAQG